MKTKREYVRPALEIIEEDGLLLLVDSPETMTVYEEEMTNYMQVW